MDAELAAPRTLMPAGAHTFIAQHGDDKGLIVEFYDEAVYQEFASEQAGKPVYKSVPHVHIFTPGGKTDIRRPVKMADDQSTPSDPRRFPRQWEAFQNQMTQLADGMPLEQWARVKKAQVLELKAARIHTVEQLAAVPDSALQNIGMGGRELRDAAISYLKVSPDGAENSRLLAENATMKTDMEMMKAQIAELSAASPKQTGKGARA